MPEGHVYSVSTVCFNCANFGISKLDHLEVLLPTIQVYLGLYFLSSSEPNAPRMQRITVSPSQSPTRLVTALCPGGSGLDVSPSVFLWSGPSLAMSRLFFLGCFPLPETLLCASFCLCTIWINMGSLSTFSLPPDFTHNGSRSYFNEPGTEKSRIWFFI